MKLSDLYKPKAGAQGPTTNGWHQIESIFRCYMEYKMREVVGARIPAIQTPDPLAKGSIFHAGRAEWFMRKFNTDAKAWHKVQDAMRKARDEASPPMSMQALTDAIGYMEQYIAHWSLLPLPKPVGVEYTLGPVALKPDSPWWQFRTARLDDVSYYPGTEGLCIGECKTTSVGIDDAENEYSLHGQLLMQFMLWRMAAQGQKKHGPAAHVMLDVVKKGYGKEKCTFARVPIHVTPTSLLWFTESMEYYLMQAARIGEYTMVPRNPKQCTRQIGRMRIPCEFRDLCKYGDKAASKYVNREGISLSTVYPGNEEKPWD